MAKKTRKEYVIYQMFWLGKQWKKWTAYATETEAAEALARLRSSPSAKYYAYEMRKRSRDGRVR